MDRHWRGSRPDRTRFRGTDRQRLADHGRGEAALARTTPLAKPDNVISTPRSKALKTKGRKNLGAALRIPKGALRVALTDVGVRAARPSCHFARTAGPAIPGRTPVKKIVPALCAVVAVSMLGACAMDYEGHHHHHRDAVFVADAYYDDSYGPYYDGYWGGDGMFYYRDTAPIIRMCATTRTTSAAITSRATTTSTHTARPTRTATIIWITRSRPDETRRAGRRLPPYSRQIKARSAVSKSSATVRGPALGSTSPAGSVILGQASRTTFPAWRRRPARFTPCVSTSAREGEHAGACGQDRAGRGVFAGEVEHAGRYFRGVELVAAAPAGRCLRSCVWPRPAPAR